jgi:hypothetical protein
MKRTVSRKGCLSCKKLKIKCSEELPSCEYCTATKRICQYPALEIKNVKFMEGRVDKKTKGSDGDKASSEIILAKLSNSAVAEAVITACSVGHPTPISSIYKRTVEELRTVHFFANKGCLVIGAGNQRGSQMWAKMGVQLSLESDEVLSGVMAFSTSLMDMLSNRIPHTRPSVEHFNAAIKNCAALLNDPTPGKALVLGLTSTLILAYAMTNPSTVPILSEEGSLETDVVGLALGTRKLNTQFGYLLKETPMKYIIFAKDVLLDAPEIELEFIEYLTSLLDDQVADHNLEYDEYHVYKETINLLRSFWSKTLQDGSMNPMVYLLNWLPEEFTVLRRKKVPFAVVVFDYVAASLILAVFRGQTSQQWVNHICDSYRLVPDYLQDSVEKALGMVAGVEFVMDVGRMRGLSRLVTPAGTPVDPEHALADQLKL